MTTIVDLLQYHSEQKVEFVVVGGVAAIAHGEATFTQDLDIVYRRTPENIDRLVEAVRPLKPSLRNAPRDLPFHWDDHTVRNRLNFTLDTTMGPLDLLGEIAGAGGYDRIAPTADQLRFRGVSVPCISLDQLIAAKRAAGRAKDLRALPELEALIEEARAVKGEEQ